MPFSLLRSVSNPLLTSLPKGIYRPAKWEYSLSIKETLNSPYGDVPIATLANGDWVYRYHREDGKDMHTNKGLLKCMQDRVPVGVLIQVAPKPNVQYFVAGLGRITQFQDPWFDLVNWQSESVEATMSTLVAEESAIYDGSQVQASLEEHIIELKEEKFTQTLIRPNQQMFRVMMLSTYQKTCAITGSKVAQVLDAAHIQPYAYKKMDKVNNGLLLRTDIHRLFDHGLIGVNENSMEAILSPKLIGSEYEEYEGIKLSLPTRARLHPSSALLAKHREKWKLA